jgi:hypothetical protein
MGDSGREQYSCDGGEDRTERIEGDGLSVAPITGNRQSP